MSIDPPTATPPGSDRLVRFVLPTAGVRGVLVHLDDAWRQIRGRATGQDGEAPAAVTELLGEAAAAAALFTGHAKVDGRLSIQLRGNGPLRTLFTECTAQGSLRGIARATAGVPLPRDLRALGGDATLAITIENPTVQAREPVRYQSLVALESESLAGAFENYFRQSEQLPTRLLLAADHDRAAGLMLQVFPDGGTGDEDGWNRAGALFETLSAGELLDWPAATVLHRLFHQEGVELLGERPLRFGCSCSRARVAAMLQSLGEDEARAAITDDAAEIHCEFCGQRYLFDRAQVAALFRLPEASSTAPERLQ